MNRFSRPLPPDYEFLAARPWNQEISGPRAVAAILLGTVVPLAGAPFGIPYEIWVIAAGFLIGCDGNFTGKLGLKIPPRGTLRLLGLGLVVMYLFVAAFGFAWQQVLDILNIAYPKEQPMMSVLRDSRGLLRACLIFSVVFTTPILEELLFRRLLYGLFRPLGPIHALLLTAVIFAAAHLYLPGFPGLFIMGLAFQIVYLKSGSLLTPVLMHAAVNAIAVAAALFLPV